LNEAKKGFCKFKEEVKLSIILLSITPKDPKDVNESVTTMSQFNTRCQILNFYDENIDTALKTLTKLEREEKDARAVENNVLTIALGDDRLCKKVDGELHVFCELGLTEIVTVKEKPPFCWKGLLVVALGVLQIAVGTVIIACSTGLLTNIGWGLVTEGINDICTGACAVYKGDQNFVKSWLVGKAAAIAFSIATLGLSHIKTALKGGKGIKAAACAVKDQLITGAEKLVVNLKEIPKTISSATLTAVVEKSRKEVAVHTGKELAKRTSKYLLGVANTKIKEYFENETRKQVKEKLKKAMAEHEFKDSLDKFIFIHSRNGKSPQEISDIFMSINKNLLSSQDIVQFRQILLGCAKKLFTVAEKRMKSEDTKVFEEFKPIFDIINTCQSHSYDVEQLISIYCERINKALKEIYASEFKTVDDATMKIQSKIVSKAENPLSDRIVKHPSMTNMTSDSLPAEKLPHGKTINAVLEFSSVDNECIKSQSEVKTLIMDSIENFLFTKIQDSFNLTVDSLLAEKVQKEVDGIVSKFSDEHGIVNHTLPYIFSISQKGLQLVNSVKQNDLSGALQSG
jgi:hypothetical protein